MKMIALMQQNTSKKTEKKEDYLLGNYKHCKHWNLMI